MNTPRAFKTTLLAACAAISLASAAHADTNLGASGFWTAVQVDGNGPLVCGLQTAFPPSRNVAILADNNDQRLAIGVSDQSWHLKPATAMLVRFDNGDNWEGGSSTEHSVQMRIAAADARAFVHDFTAGSSMTITVPGMSPIVVNLTGSTPAWAPFWDCAKTSAPSVVATIPILRAGTVAAPPAAAPAAQPDVTEVGLITEGGVKHVRGLAGSGTAIMFVLDSGAADVQITRKAALDLALTGELAATGRTSTFVTATGAKNVQPLYLLRSLTVGERTVTNVECNVTDDGDPLLGQSFLGRLGSWSTNNTKQTLVLGAAV